MTIGGAAIMKGINHPRESPNQFTPQEEKDMDLEGRLNVGYASFAFETRDGISAETHALTESAARNMHRGEQDMATEENDLLKDIPYARRRRRKATAHSQCTPVHAFTCAVCYGLARDYTTCMDACLVTEPAEITVVKHIGVITISAAAPRCAVSQTKWAKVMGRPLMTTTDGDSRPHTKLDEAETGQVTKRCRAGANPPDGWRKRKQSAKTRFP